MLAVIGAASLSDPELADPRWSEALDLAAELAGAYLVVAAGEDCDVRFGHLPEYIGTGVPVNGDVSLRLGVDEWRRAVELATVTRSVDPQSLTALLQEAGRLPAPDYSAGRRSPRANLYTRMLASWGSWVVADGERREQLIGHLKLLSLIGDLDDDGEFVAELEMMAALVAADPAAFDDALRRALAWHQAHVPDDDIEAMGHLVAYRPAALVALARKE